MSLRGSYSARIDDRNRLKIPAAFRRHVEATWGNEVFVTSLTGKDVHVYPLPVWEEFEARLLAQPLMQPARLRIQKLVNFFGQTQTMDAQGRVLLQSPLREHAGIAGEVTVLGHGNYLYIQSTDRILEDVSQGIGDDLQFISDLWSKS